MRSGNWLYGVEELLLRDRERLEDVHGEDILEKKQKSVSRKKEKTVPEQNKAKIEIKIVHFESDSLCAIFC